MLPNTKVKIVQFNDSSFRGLGVNREGGIFVREPSIINGYLRLKEATEETIPKNGWLRTCNIGFYN